MFVMSDFLLYLIGGWVTISVWAFTILSTIKYNSDDEVPSHFFGMVIIAMIAWFILSVAMAIHPELPDDGIGIEFEEVQYVEFEILAGASIK